MSILVRISVYTSVYPATDNKVWLIVNVSQPWWLEPFKCQPNVQSLWCASAGQYKFNFALCRRTVAQWYYKYLIIVLIPLFVLSHSVLCVCPLPPAWQYNQRHNTISSLLFALPSWQHRPGQSKNCFLCRNILKSTNLRHLLPSQPSIWVNTTERTNSQTLVWWSRVGEIDEKDGLDKTKWPGWVPFKDSSFPRQKRAGCKKI